jgi:hypothetical protein
MVWKAVPVGYDGEIGAGRPVPYPPSERKAHHARGDRCCCSRLRRQGNFFHHDRVRSRSDRALRPCEEGPVAAQGTMPDRWTPRPGSGGSMNSVSTDPTPSTRAPEHVASRGPPFRGCVPGGARLIYRRVRRGGHRRAPRIARQQPRVTFLSDNRADLARTRQKTLIPPAPPDIPGLDVAAVRHPRPSQVLNDATAAISSVRSGFGPPWRLMPVPRRAWRKGSGTTSSSSRTARLATTWRSSS